MPKQLLMPVYDIWARKIRVVPISEYLLDHAHGHHMPGSDDTELAARGYVRAITFAKEYYGVTNARHTAFRKLIGAAEAHYRGNVSGPEVMFKHAGAMLSVTRSRADDAFWVKFVSMPAKKSAVIREIKPKKMRGAA